MGEVILTMKGIDKSFPGVHALDHVDFEVRRGEVHALMGENGAGKSTLMKILTGIYSKDSGTITYEGKEVEFSSPREAQDAGIVIVHQELNMVNHLTVAQNIFIGREPMKGLRIDDAKMVRDSRALFDMLGIADKTEAKVGRMSFGQQQRVALMRALVQPFDFILADEPISHLDDNNGRIMGEILMHEAKAQGAGVIITSIGKHMPLDYDRILKGCQFGKEAQLLEQGADMTHAYVHPLGNTELLGVLVVEQNLSVVVVAIALDIAAESAFPLAALCLDEVEFFFLETHVLLPDVAMLLFSRCEDVGYDVMKLYGIHFFS